MEAQKYQVLPLDSTVATRLIEPRPNLTAGRREFTWSGELMTGTPNGDAPLPAQHLLYLHRGSGDSARRRRRHDRYAGGRFAGYGFYVLKGKPVFLWNLRRPQTHPLGRHSRRWLPESTLLEFDFKYDGLGMGTLAFNDLSGIGRSGTGVLKVNGQAGQRQKMEHTIPLILQWDENFDVGADTGTPVDDKDYQVPFPFHRQADQADAEGRAAGADRGGQEAADAGSSQ